MDKNEALQVIRSNFPTGRHQLCEALETLIPELKKSDDEKIRKELKSFFDSEISDYGNVEWRKGIRYGEIVAWLEKQGELIEKYEDKLDRCACSNFDKGYKAALEKQGERVDVIENFNTEFERQISHLIASTVNKEHEYNEDFVKWTANILLNYAKHEFEKKDKSSYPYQPGWRENYSGNKPKVKHSVLMLTTHGIAEGEWLGEEWCQYRWSCKVKDTEVLYWMHLSDLENLEKENEKQGEQKPADKILLDKKYKCIASPRYTTFMRGKIYKPEDKFLCSLMNFCSDCFEPTEDGEQKPADKVEPKFKVGDWITNGGLLVGQVTSFDGEYYHYICEGIEQSLHISNANNWHLWTIQDAKDGDVLATKDIVFMFKHMDKTGLSLCKSYCEVIGNSKLGLGFDFSINDVHPATKEQRDLLFSKMKEAGYKWDSEKKELKKVEQKPAWSKEDEQMFTLCASSVKTRYNDGLLTCNEYEQASLWLKSLKERMKGE